ncbi:MAG: hypothetical protein QOH48_371 [Actinomycetota bacterium]|nr:hypothetical protein [Actinomycetota bacterium]
MDGALADEPRRIPEEVRRIPERGQGAKPLQGVLGSGPSWTHFRGGAGYLWTKGLVDKFTDR